MDRLNKFLAHAGVGSRRHCDALIAAGRVKINDVVIHELGTRVDPEKHKVFVDDAPVKAEKPVYWAVHKPVGYLCTNHDPARRPLAVDLIPHVEQRVYTVGRLDEASEGLLLMTNDGALAFTLMHPKFEIEKTYVVQVAGKPTQNDLQRLLDGVWIAEGKVSAKSVKRMKTQGESTLLRIVLAEGKNREIRRMLAKLDHKVLKLKRIAIGSIELDKLPRGKSRRLTEVEIKILKSLVGKSEAKLTTLREKVTLPPRGETPVARKPFRSGAGYAPRREAGPPRPAGGFPRRDRR